MDKRWEQLGNMLVNYSTEVKTHEKVMIAMTEVESFPLVHAIYKSAIKAGAFVQVQFLSEELNHLTLKYGNTEQLNWVPEIEEFGMHWADVYFGLRGASDQDINSDISSERIAMLRRGMGKVSTARWENTRWCLLRLPNMYLAKQAGVDVKTITELFFNSCLIDWKETARVWNRWIEILKKGKNVRIIGERTDLRFSIANRDWFVGDGHINMPDGEIATAPVWESVDGRIYFEFPGVFGGRLMEDICLTWEKGRITSATSSTNQDYLQFIIQSDPGASRIGEFAFGTNPYIDLFCKDALLDEKIDGTIHIALGRSYPNCGGNNRSSIHWDIVKDTRRNGIVYLDDRVIFENGKMLI